MRKRNAHTEWLNLVEVSGPFLTLSVLDRAFHSGLDTHEPAVYRRLQEAHAEWEEIRTRPGIHRAWVRFLLQDVLGYSDECLLEGQAIPPSVVYEDPTHHERVQQTVLIADPQEPGRPKLPVIVVPPGQKLESPLAGSHWPASPLSRMQHLLQGAGLQAGFVTNGAAWSLVHVRKGEPTGYVTWQTAILAEEPITLQAFRSLLGVRRVYGSAPGDTLLDLLAQSAADQEEVTRELGRQVRQAVEVFLNALERLDRESSRKFLAGAAPKQVYDAALTVMMRLVFLLCAEQNGLLPQGDLYDRNYAVSTLNDQLREAAQQHGEEVLEHRCDAWMRLLATFRLIHGGCTHEDLKVPAYGGSLFDPARYPFLEGVEGRPLRIDNRVVLHLLDALEYLEMHVPGARERRRLSFRALGVEEIGHVYEGLLDHTARRAEEPTLGLVGKETEEPELPLAMLEIKAAESREPLVTFLAETVHRSTGAVRSLLDAEPSPHRVGQLSAACGGDEALAARVRPFLNLVRDDSLDHLQVYPAGALFMTVGQDRRSTGTHYTPVTLTEEIVRYTLEPLVYVGPAEGKLRDEWKLRSPRELLELKVCDPAMGSGAFLVQACRYLAERLVEAWDWEEQLQKTEPALFTELHEAVRVVRVAPAAAPSVPHAAELILPDDPEERLAIARRLVADHCLYGVDKNPMAVEMAKLSLWLITLAKGKPFTFLDHRLKHGDSLVGCLWQEENGKLLPLPADIPDAAYRTRTGDASVVRSLRARNDAERQGQETIESFVLSMGSADEYGKLADFPDDPEGQRQKAERYRLLHESREAQQQRLGADLWCAAWFWPLATYVGAACPTTGLYRSVLDRSNEPPPDVSAEAERPRERIPYFHWALEFPDVYAQRGFDAVVSNPPFKGGKRISGILGSDYREYLTNWIARGRKGNADLCCYFLLRAVETLRRGGGLGMLATNTIAQGDTREVALDHLQSANASLRRAVRSLKWPGSATLQVAVLWIHRERWDGSFILDGQKVPGITPLLTPIEAASGNPQRMAANRGQAFMGSVLRGIGFVLAPAEAEALLAQDPRNADVLFPYIIGEDINSRPDQSPSRYVINFFDWERERAEQYEEVFRIVRERVLPSRLTIKDEGTRKKGVAFFWRYDAQGKELYARMSVLERVLGIALTSKTLSPAFISPRQVIDQTVIVMTSDNPGFFAVVASSLHYWWALHYGASLRTDPRYSGTKCYETYAFPNDLCGLAEIGERYHGYRRQLMLTRQEGLTKTYNRFHNRGEVAEDIRHLRELHVEMDHVVASTYGWADLDLGHGFHVTKEGTRYTLTEGTRREVLDRLLKLNHERYAEELAQGLHEKGAGKGKRSKETRVPSTAPITGEDGAGLLVSRRRNLLDTQLSLGEVVPADARCDEAAERTS